MEIAPTTWFIELEGNPTVPVYKFVISMPVTDTLPRNRISNTIHMEHVNVQQGTDLGAICDDLVAMYATRYGHADKEIACKAYDTDAVPNYPRASSVINAGVAWPCQMPHEIALCLSYYGDYAGNKNERGRIYLMPQLTGQVGGSVERPSPAMMQWALDFYTASNASFPDIGGIDWKFGVYSPTRKTFKQSQHAWVDDEWDTMRSRGLRPTTRLEASREG